MKKLISDPGEQRCPAILIVDDNPKNIVTMKNVLSEFNIDMHEAYSGQEALKKVIRNNYALILLDVQMPEMDGFEVAKCLSQNEETAKIPIIFVTALSSEHEKVIEGYTSGAVDFLSKPFEPIVLKSKIRIFLSLYEERRKLAQALKQISFDANFDPLTNLSNRRQFNRLSKLILENCSRRNREFAFILLDLDNFKHINDSYGHDVGDLLLIEVAKRLSLSLRKSDYVARLGGDEFAIILPEIDGSKMCVTVANAIRSKITDKYQIQKHEFIISTSIGIATFPQAGQTVQDLFKSADVALYHAKAQGKNNFQFYTPHLNQKHQRESIIASELIHAIERNEITLLYQPWMDLKCYGNEISGVEVLARWDNSKLGNVSPSEFIAISESVGFISTLGKHIVRQALKQYQEWLVTFPSMDMKMAINISPKQLLNNNFPEFIMSLFSKTQIKPEKIKFEITESTFEKDDQYLKKSIKVLSDFGIKFAIDDFGTGYSSLSRLKNLPIQLLKIDQSFVRDILKDPNDAAIVQAIIALSKALDLETIAEGVENEEQAKLLTQYGGNFAQGYYFSKPSSAQQISQILRQTKLI